MMPDLVLAAIRKHQPAGTPPILLACSGGVDSQVLLHCAASIWPAQSLVVAHVHHGLQPQADDWLEFCRRSASVMGLSFMARRLPPMPDKPRSGVEAWARRLRYQALAGMAAQADAGIVLTAHHANDQLETHELRRLRGAGPLGLGAMRSGAPLPGAPLRLLLRPFLGVDRQRIVDYAHSHALAWIDDPSNRDLRYARNRIRREIAQALSEDPGNLQRGLAQIGQFQQLADGVRRQARQDLDACRVMVVAPGNRWGGPTGAAPGPAPDPGLPLSRASLASLPGERAAEALRLWIEEAGMRMPSRAWLAEAVRQLLCARSAHPRLRHDGRWLLRYRDRIEVADELPISLSPVWFRWSGEALLSIAGQQFLFHRRPLSSATEAGLPFGGDLLMDQGRGGDRLRTQPGAHQRTLKNLHQERGIPPWMRAALPVLRRGGGLVYAAPFGMNHAATAIGPAGITIEWVAPPQWTRWL